MDKVTIITVKNPFDVSDREIKQVDYVAIKTLEGYIREAPCYDEDGKFCVSVNGHLVDEKDWSSTTVRPGSYIAICPVVEKRGGLLGVLASIALSVITVGVGNLVQYGTMFGAAAARGIAGWTFGAFLAATATMYVGGMLVSHLMPQPKIDFPCWPLKRIGLKRTTC